MCTISWTAASGFGWVNDSTKILSSRESPKCNVVLFNVEVSHSVCGRFPVQPSVVLTIECSWSQLTANQLGVQVDSHLREQLQPFVLQKSGSFAAKQLLVSSTQKASNFLLAERHNAFDHRINVLVAGVESHLLQQRDCGPGRQHQVSGDPTIDRENGIGDALGVEANGQQVARVNPRIGPFRQFGKRQLAR